MPYQAFATTDGYVLAGATNDAAWQRLCAAIGAADLAANPAYATPTLRIENREPMIAALSKIFAMHETAHWVALLDAANVPCSPVNDIAQTVAHPQVQAMQMVIDVADGRGAPLRMVGVPSIFSGTPAKPGGMPPDLGEHTDSILKTELGLAEEEIAALRKEKTI